MTTDEPTRPRTSDPEVPEADAVEQATPADGVRPSPVPRVDVEVPEADALEQAAEWPSDADDDYEHTVEDTED